MRRRSIAAIVCISWCHVVYAQELKPRVILEGHSSGVFSLAFSPDGKTLASGSRDDIRLWELTTGKNIATLEYWYGHSLYFSPDGKSLANVGGFGISMWDIATRKKRTLRDEKWDYQCIRFMGCFSPDGKILAAGGLCFSKIGLWDVNTGKLIRLLEDQTEVSYCLFTDTRFTPDGKALFAYGSTVGIRKWDVASGKSLPVVDLSEPFRMPDRMWNQYGAFSPDCKLLAVSIPSEHEIKDDQLVVKTPGYVTILDVATGKPTATLRGFAGDVLHLTFSKDGKTLAAGDGKTDAVQRDYVVRFWDVATGRESGSLKTDDGIHSMAFSPDGKTLAIGYAKKTIRLWDVPAKK